MSKQRVPLILLVAALWFNVVTCFGQTVPPASQQDMLIAVLKDANASRQQKATALRQLSFIATKRAIPTLASLLADDELNHMTRYTLETIPDTAVDTALLQALDKLNGKPLVGVIGSLGVRKETRAVSPLTAKLTDQNPLVAQAAARALGHIGNAEAAKGLSRALSGSVDDTKLAVCEGLFRCAEKLGGSAATKIYNQLLQLKTPHQVRAGALCQLILILEDGLDLLKTHLKSEDYSLFSAATQTALHMPDPKVTQALVAALNGLPVDHQVVILGTLAKRGDPAALSAILTATAQGNPAIRIAAIKAIPPISADASALDTLVILMKDADKQVAQAAQASLAALPGPAADKAVCDMLETGDRASQLQALELIKRRRMTQVSPALLKAAKDNDTAVRTASIRMLGDLNGAEWFPVLIELLLDAQGTAEMRAAEQALSAMCKRDAQPIPGQVTIVKAVYGAVGAGGSADVTKKVRALVEAGAFAVGASNTHFGDTAPGVVKQLQIEFTVGGITRSLTVKEGQTATLLTSVTPPAYVKGLCAAVAKAPPLQKRTLLRLLRVAQGSEALKTIRGAIQDEDAGVRGEAVSIFCAWPSVEVLPEVLALAKTATDNKVKILALRGAIRLIPLQNIPVQAKLADFKALQPLIKQDQETRLLLGALADIPHADSLAMATAYLDDATTRNEACFAVVAIAEKVAPKDGPRIREALQKLLKTTNNTEVKKRARQVLARI